MINEYCVVKFGDKYLAKEGLQEFRIGGDSIILELTDDILRAKYFEKDDLSSFVELMELGGRIIEVSLYEIDKTYSIRDEIEKYKKSLEDGSDD